MSLVRNKLALSLMVGVGVALSQQQPAQQVAQLIWSPRPGPAQTLTECATTAHILADNAAVKFASTTYVRGLPVLQVEQFRGNENDIRANGCALLALLNNSQSSDYWANAAYMIGLIGYVDGVNQLVRFATSDFDVNSPSAPGIYRAKHAAFVSLGYLLNRADEQQKPAVRTEIRRLLSEVRTRAHDNSLIQWQSPYSDNSIERSLEVMESLLLACGLSGDSDLIADLTSFRDTHTATIRKATTEEILYPGHNNLVVTRQQLQSLIAKASGALAINDQVRNHGGLLAYYTPNRQ